MEASTGQCRTCGYLCKFTPSTMSTPKFFEMDEHGRETGKAFFHALDRGMGNTPSKPMCFLHLPDVQQEFNLAADYMLLRSVINKDRQCRKWHAYTPGFSPQEHLQEFKMNELELKRQEFEHKMQEDNKSFMGELHASNRNLQIFLAAVVAIFAIAQMAFPNGWPWLMRLLGVLPIEPPLPPMPGL